ncbi:MAG: AAA family ATPase [Chloroflexi bacterium]|nr:AAA family ATPase [Chloroflexota bacterium]
MPAGPDDAVAIRFDAIGVECAAYVIPGWWREPNAEDVAMLRPKTPLPEGVVPLPLGSLGDDVEAAFDNARGRVFHAWGFPHVKPEGMSAQAEIIGHATENGHPVLQLRSSELMAGFSGAPLWDDDLGVVVGVVVSDIVPGRDLKGFETAFLIPTSTLYAVLPELRPPESCPYPGLAFFREADADRYFGRDGEIRELLEMLIHRSFVSLIGSSGSGKSSLVRAGLEKGMREFDPIGLSRFHRVLFTPDRHPILSMLWAVAFPEELRHRLLDNLGLPRASSPSESLHKMLSARAPKEIAHALRSASRDMRAPLLLIADQFERVFGSEVEEAERAHFIATLLAVASDDVKILVVLRADFYESVLQEVTLAQKVEQGRYVLFPLDKENLREAIVEPARRARCFVQPALTERLIGDVRGQAGNLPLLQFALEQLWTRDHRRGTLTLETYEKQGFTDADGRVYSGLEGAMIRRAEDLWHEGDDEERAYIRSIFLGLVGDQSSDPGRGYIGRRAWLDEWDDSARPVINRWVNARLLMLSEDPLTHRPTVEVAHEAILRGWPRLCDWLADYGAFIQWRNHELIPRYRLWEEKGRRRDDLLPHEDALLAERWLRQYSAELRGALTGYIRASLNEIERRQKWRRAVFSAVIAAAIAFFVFGLWAFRQRNLAVQKEMAAQAARATALAESNMRATAQAEAFLQRDRAVSARSTAEAEVQVRATAQAIAEASRREAEQQRRFALARQLAAQAQYMMLAPRSNTEQVLAPLLAMEALRRAPSFEAMDVMQTVLFNWPVLRVIYHEGSVWDVDFSPDGRYLATRSEDGAAALVEVETGREVARVRHEDIVWDVDFSPNGRYLATRSRDTVALVEMASGREVTRIRHEGSVLDVDFGPDGRYLATRSGDDTAALVEVESGREVTRIRHEGDVFDVVFSPGGRYLATASRDDAAALVEVESGREVTRIRHDGAVFDGVFSPDSRYLATGSLYTAALVEVASGREVTRIRHEGPVWGVDFSLDGRYLATASWDGAAALVEVESGREVTRIRHVDSVRDVIFSPDGRYLATASEDGAAALVEVESGREVTRIRHESDVEDVVFSPDGRYLATASEDGAAALVEVASGREVTRIGDEGSVLEVDFSPNGRYLATRSWDGTVALVEVESGREVTRIRHESFVLDVDFSPDSRYLATRSGDTVVLVEVASGREVTRIRHESDVEDVIFSPDGRYLATGSRDGAAALVEVASGREVTRIRHEDVVLEVDFSADGRYLATAGGEA